MDLARAAAAVADYLRAMDADPDDPRLRETPARVAELGAELFAGLGRDGADALTEGSTFDEQAGGPVALRELPFRALCEHHLVPFGGRVSVVYLPDGRVAGLGAVERCIDVVSSRPTLQERFTDEVADAVERGLGARGVLVRATATHACVWGRGRRTRGSSLATLAGRGVYEETGARGEALSLLIESRSGWIAHPLSEPIDGGAA